MFGVGGAVFSNPGLRVLGAAPVIAIGSTLPSIVPSAVVGTIAYTRNRLVDWHVARLAGVSGILFAIAAARLTPLIPGDGHPQSIAIAGFLAFTGWRLLTASGHRQDDQKDGPRPSTAVTILTGAGAGAIAGFLGLGGGVVLVPAFVEVLGLSIKKAVATSLVVVGILAIPSAIVHWALGNINWRFALLVTVGVIPGSRLGSLITIGSAERTIRRLFGVFITILAVGYATAELVTLLRR